MPEVFVTTGDRSRAVGYGRCPETHRFALQFEIRTAIFKVYFMRVGLVMRSSAFPFFPHITGEAP